MGKGRDVPDYLVLPITVLGLDKARQLGLLAIPMPVVTSKLVTLPHLLAQEPVLHVIELLFHNKTVFILTI